LCKVFISVFIFSLCVISSWGIAQPTVSVSIKPLQLITAAITAGLNDLSEPGLIIGPEQDPHHPFMRPSERQTLYDADILLWVGPLLEAALEDLIKQSSASVIHAYELIEGAGLSMAEIEDPHIWLSTQNARLIATELTERLRSLDNDNSQHYVNNLADFNSSMNDLDAEVNIALQGLKTIPFAVYHNAFRYYEEQYGLAHIASFTENEELQAGIRKVLEVRASLAANNVSCMLLEPSNDPDEINQLTGRDMNLVSIDILGFEYAATKTAYRDFMRGITQSITGCLQP
jgi:zinc transport system substrate-binding protein